MLLIPAAVRKLRNEGREEGRNEGRKEGREEANAEWVAWFERYREAEASGQDFTEPPPLGANGKVSGK